VARWLDSPASPPLEPEATLDAAVQALTAGAHAWLAVVEHGRVVGVVGMSEVIGAYRDALRANLQVLARPRQSILVEQRVAAGAPVAGQPIAATAWPAGTVILAIQREEELIFPEGSTRLEPGDHLSALAAQGAADRIRALLLGPTEDETGESSVQPMGMI
jgi:hypothetical protein